MLSGVQSSLPTYAFFGFFATFVATASRIRALNAASSLASRSRMSIARRIYEEPGRSPDRADALVWALSELMLGRKAEPRVRRL